MPARSSWEGISVPEWEHRWGIPRLEVHDRLPSTNDRARELADRGTPAFTTVIAEEQTAGRGRGGRTWVSPSGVGLWLSTVASPGKGPGAALTPIFVGLATVRAMRATLPDVAAMLKWPNDVFVRDRKACGILCETVAGSGAVVVGVGINVRQREEEFPPDLAGRAISLEQAAGRRVSRSHLATELMNNLVEILSRPADTLGPYRAELDAVDLLRGQPVRVSTGLEGVASGIADDGALLVRDRNGAQRHVRAGTMRIITAVAGISSVNHPHNGA